MKNEQETREYLDNHFFINRIHAHAVRAVIIDKFKSKDFEFKYASNTQLEYKGVSDNLITATDAIKYIWDELL